MIKNTRLRGRGRGERCLTTTAGGFIFSSFFERYENLEQDGMFRSVFIYDGC